MNHEFMAADFYQELSEYGIQLSPEQRQRIEEKINSVLTYEPRIGIFSKSGVGKSSLCNALFGQDVCPISDITACTRNVQEVLLEMGGKGLKLIDVPGVGESSHRDKEYTKLYAKLLPELDCVLWLLKADERAYMPDEIFYREIVKPHISQGKPFFFVLNQVDKMEPSDEWNTSGNLPGSRQFHNINLKIEAISRYFNIAASKIIPVSAKYNYNLPKLVDEIVYALPREKKITFLRGTAAKYRSIDSVAAVKKAWYEGVGEFLLLLR